MRMEFAHAGGKDSGRRVRAGSRGRCFSGFRVRKIGLCDSWLVPTTSAGSLSSWWKWGIVATVLAVAAGVLGGLAAGRLYAVPEALPGTTAAQSPAVAEPGPYTVELSTGAAQHPDSAKVLQVLRTYFSAINSKQYDQWVTTVVAAKAKELPPTTWLGAYASTNDGSVRVDNIESTNGALLVLLSFTSVQDLSHAPPQLPAACVRWRVMYRMVQESGSLRLDATVLPGSVLVERCS